MKLCENCSADIRYCGCLPSHDYECPCDLCEPEAHSVRELPTVAPTSADVEVAAFEELIKKVGEGKARWSKLLELLES